MRVKLGCDIKSILNELKDAPTLYKLVRELKKKKKVKRKE